MEKRGFNLMVQGVPAEQMPVIVPRICGVCSTAHHVAAVKALEDAYGVTPPTAGGRRIRELLLLGQMIQNQATSLFIFTMPDRLGVDSIFHVSEEEASTRLPVQHRPARAADPPAGHRPDHPGRRAVHPPGQGRGGRRSAAASTPQKLLNSMTADCWRLLPAACELVEFYWEISMRMNERIGTWGDDQPAYYITSTERDMPATMTQRPIRVMTPRGRVLPRPSPPAHFRELPDL